MAESLSQNAHFMNQYSRQIGVFGMETMAKLIQMRVLIVGLRGVGIETAKNLILAGPGAVTVYDPFPAEIKDLGTNFFLSESDVGTPLADAVVSKLKELNKMVDVSVVSELTEAIVGSHTVVFFSNTKKSELIRWNQFCRSAKPTPIGFIVCDIRGAAGYVFTDFGDSFKVNDSNGEAPAVRVVTNVSTEEEGLVTLVSTGRRHGLEEEPHSGWVELSEVQGMRVIGDEEHSINDAGPFRIKHAFRTITSTKKGPDGVPVVTEKKVFDGYALRIGDTRKYTAYEGGGIMTQVRVPIERKFRPLTEALLQPVSPGSFGLLFTDGSKFGRAEQLHVAFQGLLAFEEATGREPASPEDEAAVLAAALQHNALAQALPEGSALVLETVEEPVVRSLARYAAVELQPMAAFFGGVAAQEIVKFTSKFSPLDQFLYIDAFEVLPETPATDTQPMGCRYDHNIAMFGRAFQEKLGGLKTFMVGCGALGCEYLKNFALMGIACGPSGLVTVTDNDRIEVSNLNRQFLFRDHNVGQPKSRAAAAAAVAMNPALHVESLEVFVAPKTENVFHDAFWNSIDFVTNALDNVTARLYVDSRCVFFGKPLFESGTLGTKCNAQVILPHITSSYSDQKDAPDEDAIPMCTLRNFPSLIDHCIEWGRALFTDLFVAPPAEVNKFLADRDAFLADLVRTCVADPNVGARNSALATALPKVRAIRDIVRAAHTASFETCVHMAADRFTDLFRDRLLDLTYQYPADAVTSDGGKFWSGAKRFPLAAELSLADPVHMSFLVSAANLYAVFFGLIPPPEAQIVPLDHAWRQPATVAAALSTYIVRPWAPPSLPSVREEDGGPSDEIGSAAADSEFAGLLEELRAVEIARGEAVNPLRMEPADFEKDVDLNFHIDFITAAANLRALNYHIKVADRHKVKMIAGKIIPALATTTAGVTGLVTLEILKRVQGKPLSAFRDSSNNLGINGYFFSEPQEAVRAKDGYDEIEMEDVQCRPPGFTKWDKTLIDGTPEFTMARILTLFTAATGLHVKVLLHEISNQEGPRRGLFLYEASPWKPENRELYASKMETPFLQWLVERYGDAVLPKDSRMVCLDVSAVDDEDHMFKVPTLVFRY